MPNLIDLTGQRFERLVVLEKAPSRNRKVYWKCQCDCGNIIETRGDRLKEGRVKSCGCYAIDKIKEVGHRNAKDMLGQKFGFLTVIKRSPIVKNDHCAYWFCRCDCGSIVEVSGVNLRTGNTKSCGCIKSYGEQKINKILSENNILFKTQYTFPDLLSKENNLHSKLKFDFAIFQNKDLHCLIEYQGIQHYDSSSKWYRVENDNKKREYCQKNSIKLVEIPYTDLEKIDWEYLQERIFND